MKYYIIIISLFLISCAKKNEELTDFEKPEKAALYYVQCMKDGMYDECIQGMISCDSASVDYKEKMLVLYKQMIHSANDTIKNIDCKTTEVKYDGNYACVYIKVLTSSGRTEVVMLPLIWNNERWRLR